MSGKVIVGRFGRAPEEALRAADREARREAQRRFDRPLILQAGAGTGKTTTLIGRLLAWTLGIGWERALARRTAGPAARPLLQREGAISPERIAADVLHGVVAITFTEAAAAEMAGRTARELGSLAHGGAVPAWLDRDVLPSPGEIVDRSRALLGALDHLAVRTIHAFCLGLLAEHPLEAGVHPQLKVDADGRLLDEVVREVVEAALREGYGDPGDPDLLTLAVRGFGPQEIVEALTSLAQAELPAGALERDFLGEEEVRAFGERLATACEAVHGLISPRLAGGVRAPNARSLERGLASLIACVRENGGVGELAALRGWVDELLPENLTEHLHKWEKGQWNATEARLLAEAGTDLCARSGALRRLLEHLRRVDPELLGAGLRALAPSLAAVSRQMRARGIATFAFLLTGAESLLARHAEVRARVRRGIDQLLVDEFQDTDRVQCEILRWIALDGPRDERPGLFLVGDPKQSIYGWRSADLRAYDGFVELARRHGGEVMPLVENFRSVPSILAEVARVVEPVMVARPGLQPAFEPLLACERRHADPEFRRGDRAPVEHWVSWTLGGESAAQRDKTSVVEAAELEAAALAADVRSLHDTESVPWKEIALLLRGTGDLDTYLEALRRAGVPFVVGRDKQYYRRREVIEAAALVRAVIDPGDHLALLTVLRSALVGVPDAALIPLWRREFPRLVTDLTPVNGGEAVLRERLDVLRAVIADAVREVPVDVPGIERLHGWDVGLLAALEHLACLRLSFDSEPADLFIERLRRLFLVEAVEAARYLGPYRLANLERFFRQLLASIEEGGGDLTAILRSLRRSVAEEREAEEGRPQEGAEDAVQVMTIHGAKGLDFQHVYLMQLHKQSGGEAGPRTEAGCLDDGRIEVRLFGAPSLGFDRVEAERARIEAAERVRTLYVAMTRAKDRLVLAATWPEREEPKAPEQARTHLDLLLSRADRPAVLELWERKIPLFSDATGALWKFPALLPALEAAAPNGIAPAADDLPSPEEVGRDSAVLSTARTAAAARSSRPFGGAASEEAHALLRQQQAERRLGEERTAVRQGGEADREAAMAAGGAVHRALEEWDLTAEPAVERDRQRERLVAYLAPLASGEVLDRALPRAVELVDRFAQSGLLERLRSLRGAVLARELPVLIPPGDGPDAPVGVVTGAIDLLYRDPETGQLVVADYKTDDLAPEDLESRAAAYAPQGAFYVRAVQEALDLAAPPRFELWFLRADRVVRHGIAGR